MEDQNTVTDNNQQSINNTPPAPVNTPVNEVETVVSNPAELAQNLNTIFNMASTDESNGINDKGERYFLGENGKPLYETEQKPDPNKEILSD